MEIWKDIIGYENSYQVSNKWNVKSLDRYSRNGKCEFLIKWKILRKTILNRWKWYETVWLWKENTNRTVYVHRLVSECFVEWKSSEKNQVNHIDWDTRNNNSKNLEWCSAHENLLHAYSVLWFKWWNFWRRNKWWKKVVQYDLEWNFLMEYESIADVFRKTWFSKSGICECCKWNYGWKIHWFIWKYAK